MKSEDVNAYLQEAMGQDFTAKDFRTWAGTVLAATALNELQAFDSKTAAKRNIVHAIENVAKRLGNTKAVCRRCYVHPSVFESYLNGSFSDLFRVKVQLQLKPSSVRLSSEERALLSMLRRNLKIRKPCSEKQA